MEADLCATARTIFTQALAACSPERAFQRVELDLSQTSQLLIIAAGKCATPMLQGLLRTLAIPPQCIISGILIAPVPSPNLPTAIRHFAGGHPVPNPESFAGAEAALNLLRNASPGRTFCLFLLSGGASAMMELPLDRSISLADTIQFHRALVHSGATIAEINCIRKHFSAVKGGRLGALAAAIPNLTLFVSDVPANQLDALASGPTLPDQSTLTDCHRILETHSLLDRFPASVRQFLTSPNLPETPKPGDFPAQTLTLLSSADLAQAALHQVQSLGFHGVIDNTCDDWSYREAAQYLLARLRDLRRNHKKLCLISTGEVTVQLPPQPHPNAVGGRNQHFALYAATLLQPEDRRTAILSAGSDGIDGNSPYAGAVLGAPQISAASLAGDALLHFDSSTFLNAIGATITTGPTGTNLRDLRLLLVDET